MSSPASKTLVVTPRQTLRGHTNEVRGVVHLPEGRRIVTCSFDGSLRLWDLESCAQIGKDWRDEGEDAALYTISLSPIGNTVASGSRDGTVRLWDIETGKVVARWSGHAERVCSVCWSTDGERVMSGSFDETTRVRDVKKGETILGPIRRHQWVLAVMYSPDNTKFATAGHNENAVKIWDAKTGELVATLEHYHIVCSLAWTSDGKKLISGSSGPIRMFDTATWQQVAILKGHKNYVNAISLPLENNRLLASASDDQTARLWDLETNLPVGPPLQHENSLECATFSPDGQVLITGGRDNNAHVWDVHAILKEVGLPDLLHSPEVVDSELIDTDATQAEDDELPPDFFTSVQGVHAHSSITYRRDHRPSTRYRWPLASSFGNASVLSARLSTLFRRSPSNINEAVELQQRPKRSIFSQRGPHVVEVAAVRDKRALVVAPQIIKKPQQLHGESQGAQSLPLQTQPAAASTSTTPPTVTPDTHTTTLGAGTVQINLFSLLARIVLFLCCASHTNTDGH